MKFGQLIGCYMRNIFLEKSYTKCGGWTSPRSFSEKLKLNILWINSLSFYTVCFYCMQSWGPSKYMKTNLKTTCFYLILSFFLHNLKKKYSSCCILLNWPSFIVWLLLLREMLDKICIVIVYWPGCDVINFQVNLIFLIKFSFLHDQKGMLKT